MVGSDDSDGSINEDLYSISLFSYDFFRILSRQLYLKA